MTREYFSMRWLGKINIARDYDTGERSLNGFQSDNHTDWI